MKKIKILFKKLQDDKQLLEKLTGELTLKGDTIVWSYDLDNDAEEIDICQEELDDSDVTFEEVVCVEEYLTEAYETDLEEIEDFITSNDDIGEYDFSNSIIKGTCVSFKIS
jgi:hypothetical protein